MPKPEDRVTIKLGPTRYDSPKAIRDLARAETEESVQNAVSNVTGVVDSVTVEGVIEIAEVVTYDSATGVGTASTGLSGEVYFVNATLIGLSPGDLVAVGKIKGFDWYALIGTF